MKVLQVTLAVWAIWTIPARADDLRASIGTVRTTSSRQMNFLPSLHENEFLFSIDARIRNLYNAPHNDRWIHPFAHMELEALVSLDLLRPYRVWKNEYRVDTSLIGFRYESESEVSQNGFEIAAGGDYYRPRLASNAVGWNDGINDRFPHLQYFTWRTTGGKSYHEFPVGPAALRASLAGYHVFSQNSSLPMHDKQNICQEVDGKPVNQISKVFRGKCNTKQNYYYSQGYLVESDFAMRYTPWGEVAIRDSFFSFYPLLDTAPVRDTVNRARTAVRWFAATHLDVEAGFELWSVWGRHNEERESRRWASFWLALAYRL